jgi:hypothetical protein
MRWQQQLQIRSFVEGVVSGPSSNWQIRCTKCGQTRDAAEAGILRIGAWSWKKYTLVRCSNCRRLRFAAVERKPAPSESATF